METLHPVLDYWRGVGRTGMDTMPPAQGGAAEVPTPCSQEEPLLAAAVGRAARGKASGNLQVKTMVLTAVKTQQISSPPAADSARLADFCHLILALVTSFPQCPPSLTPFPESKSPSARLPEDLAQMWTDAGADGRPTLRGRRREGHAGQLRPAPRTQRDARGCGGQFATVVNSRAAIRAGWSSCVRCTPTCRRRRCGRRFTASASREVEVRQALRRIRAAQLPAQRPAFLENQVSICLSTDLPLYYWAHRFSASGRLADYRYLLGRAKRVLLDSAIAPAGCAHLSLAQPEGDARSRLLPAAAVRQTIGQFLAGYRPDSLVDGLRGRHGGARGTFAAEARVALAWLRRRLAACGAAVDTLPGNRRALDPAVGCQPGGKVRLHECRVPRWNGDLRTGQALFEADFGAGCKLSAAVSLLPPRAR